MKIKKHIVSIDDEDNILVLIGAILSQDFDLTTFNDTTKALELAPTLKPDLIICDINMPGLDGFEIHQAFREIPGLRGVPFIYLTGLADREHFRKGMNQGADDYLTKPFTADELKEVVNIRLQRAEHLREDECEIKSLGSVAVTAEGKILEYEAKKVIELLLYLLTKGKRVVWRDLFNDLWWEEVNDNSVHVLLGRARKTFEGLAEFVIEDDMLQLHLSRPYIWDAQGFETEAKAALETKNGSTIEKSIQLYKGPFLKDFDSPWSNTQRDYYEDLYVKLLELSIAIASSETQRHLAQKRLDTFWNEE